MNNLFLGQKVKLVVSKSPKNINKEGVIVAIAHLGPGDHVPKSPCVLSDDAPSGTYYVVEFTEDTWNHLTQEWVKYARPCQRDSLVPILPEGHKPSEYSYEELLEHIKTKQMEKVA